VERQGAGDEGNDSCTGQAGKPVSRLIHKCGFACDWFVFFFNCKYLQLASSKLAF